MRSIFRNSGLGFIVASLIAVPVLAEKPTTKAPKTASAQATVKAPKTTSSVKTSTKAPKPAKTTTTSTAAATKASGKAAPATAKADTKSTKHSAGASSSSAAWQPTNAVSQKLSGKPNLLSKVRSSLPAGTDLNAATAGFKNFGQFVAAINVSNNLGINFADLKTAMTGMSMTGVTSTQPTMSLGQAIQRFRPEANADVEAQTAQTLASQEIVAPVKKTKKSASASAL